MKTEFTLEKAISEYSYEIQELKNMKKSGISQVSADAYDIDEQYPNAEMINVDVAIEIWEKKLAELQTGEVDPADYEY